jgi:hypothetical protein
MLSQQIFPLQLMRKISKLAWQSLSERSVPSQTNAHIYGDGDRSSTRPFRKHSGGHFVFSGEFNSGEPLSTQPTLCVKASLAGHQRWQKGHCRTGAESFRRSSSQQLSLQFGATAKSRERKTKDRRRLLSHGSLIFVMALFKIVGHPAAGA